MPVLPARYVVRFLSEHIISGNMHQKSVCSLHSLSQILHCLTVQNVCRGPVILRLVHVSIGRTVHDGPYSARLHHIIHGRRIRDIQIHRFHPGKVRDIRKDVPVSASCTHYAHMSPELAVRPCHQYVHSMSLLSSVYALHSTVSAIVTPRTGLPRS